MGANDRDPTVVRLGMPARGGGDGREKRGVVENHSFPLKKKTHSLQQLGQRFSVDIFPSPLAVLHANEPRPVHVPSRADSDCITHTQTPYNGPREYQRVG